jgi:hypothetical protein
MVSVGFGFKLQESDSLHNAVEEERSIGTTSAN